MIRSPGESRAFSGGWVARLRAFVAPKASATSCELCSAPAGALHAHVLEVRSGRLVCCCRGCALLFGEREGARYRRIPESVMPLPRFELPDAQWDALDIPVAIAFFYWSSAEQRMVACYPGGAGAVRSALDLTAWNQIVAANPVLQSFAPDVEALLVNRAARGCGCYRVPIDQCYALIGTLRRHWVGITGGDGARTALAEFFARLANGEAIHA